MSHLGADRLLQPDLTDALRDRHQHGVDDGEAADNERNQRRAGGDGGEDRTARVEAGDQHARLGCLDPGDLGVDFVRELVEVLARRAVHRRPIDELGGVNAVADAHRKRFLQKHLGIGEAHVRPRIGSGLRLRENSDHGEGVVDEVRRCVFRPDGQVDRVTDVLLELRCKVRSQDNFAVGVDLATLRGVDLEGAVGVGPRVRVGDVVRDPEGNRVGTARFGRDLHIGKCRRDAVDLFQGRDAVECQQAAAEGANRPAGAVRDLDVRPKVRRATGEQRVELFGHRAHRDQGEYADHDAADRQDVAQLAPRQISNDFHGSSSGVADSRLTGEYGRTVRSTSRSGQLFRMTSVIRRRHSLPRSGSGVIDRNPRCLTRL